MSGLPSSSSHSLLSLRLRLHDDARLGPGKIALLEAVARSGSIAEAGQTLDMSERRASLLIESLTAFFGEPVVIADPKSGAMLVSPLGQELIAAFRAVEADALQSFEQNFASLLARMPRSG